MARMEVDSPSPSPPPPLRFLLGVILVPLIAVFGLQVSSAYTPLVLAAYSLQLMILMAYYTHMRIVPSAGWTLCAIVLAITHVLSLISSGEVFGSVNAMDIVDAGARVVGFVLFAALANRLSLTITELQKFFRFLVLVGVVAVGGAMIVSPPWWILLSSASSHAVNFSAFFGSRNQLGGYLFIAIAALILSRKSFATQGWFSVTFAVLFLGLLVTMSRSAIGATVVMLGVILALRYPFSKFPVALGGVLTLFAILRLNPGAWSQFERLFVRSDSGVTGREELWAHGIRLFGESPLFGVGGFKAVEVAQGAGMVNNQFHSFYIEALAGGGLAGLVLRSAVLLFVLYQIIIAWTHGREGADLYVAAFSGLFMMLAFESVSFFSIGYVDTLFSMFFVFVPLVLFSSSRESRRFDERGNERCLASGRAITQG